MPRTLLCFVLLAACALTAPADQAFTSTETVIRLTVQAMPAPKPALRYQLLPEIKERNPGNPVQGYLRCFPEHQSFFLDREVCQPGGKLQLAPLREPPAQEVEFGAAALREADRAARLDKPDWQILLQLKTEGVGLLLPDLQPMRNLANGLKGRFRSELALHRFDDAIRTAKTMFALSRHVGEHPTLIGDLVAIAVAYTTIEPLQEMLEQSGCPNLYWALTNLPSPLVSLEKGLEGERIFIAAEFVDLDDKAPMSQEQLKKLIKHIDDALNIRSARDWVEARIKDEGLVRAARRRLVEVGFPEERLLRFPAEQVILLDEMREYEARRDDAAKLMTLPHWQIEALTGPDLPKKEPALFDAAQSALLRVHRVQGRLEQRIALLRHVEALRIYAAEHDGKLPEKLSDVTVPLPPDPFTGKPFHYHVDGTTAHLRGTPPRGEEKTPNFNIHYEVTIQK